MVQFIDVLMQTGLWKYQSYTKYPTKLHIHQPTFTRKMVSQVIAATSNSVRF